MCQSPIPAGPRPLLRDPQPPRSPRFRAGSISSTSLSCLDIWRVYLSINTAGLVEVYLGDIGRDMPPQEWPHWLNHNVRPEGRMSPDRFRRDFCNQFASSDDPTGDIRVLRGKINSAALDVLGGTLWRELAEPDKTEFERLHSVTDPASLKLAILSLCKAFIEAIDKKILASYLGTAKKEPSTLKLMENLVESLEGDRTIVESLKALQHFRSKGGIAHMVSSQRTGALERLGIEGMEPVQAFETIITNLLATLSALDGLLSRASEQRATAVT